MAAYPAVARWARRYLVAILLAFVITIAAFAGGQFENTLVWFVLALVVNATLVGLVLALRPVYRELSHGIAPLALAMGLTTIITGLAQHPADYLGFDQASSVLQAIALLSFAAWLALAAWAWHRVDMRPSASLVTALALVAAIANVPLAAYHLGLAEESLFPWTLLLLLEIVFYIRLARHQRPVAMQPASAG
jgi:hypothetical protein